MWLVWAKVSNLPPSSALTAEGERKASKHPQSQTSKSIFSPRVWRNNAFFSPPLWCVSESRSPLLLSFFPQFSVSLKRNSSSAQNPPRTPGCEHQEYRAGLALFSCITACFFFFFGGNKCDLRKLIWNQHVSLSFSLSPFFYSKHVLNPQNPWRCAQSAALCPPVSLKYNKPRLHSVWKTKSYHSNKVKKK